VGEERTPPWLASPERAACWWGQALLALAAGLTVLAYVASRASYLFLTGSVRYLNGLLLCTPLLVAVLWQTGQPAWRWLVARGPRSAGERLSPRPSLRACLALALLIATFAINLLGVVQEGQATADREAFGVPAGGRDARLLSFLYAHGVTDFYAGYWTCYRLLFESAEREICAVRSDTNVFAADFNRIPRYMPMVAGAAHPAYVFDLVPNKDTPDLPAQVTARIAAGDSRFAGYQVATFDAFEVIYYAGR
jgi:hypothetical protein